MQTETFFESTPDYFEAPFELPKQRFVGILSAQTSPWLSELSTTVTACRLSENHAPKTNQAKKAAKSKKDESSKKYEIELEDTVLFPEGGGQPNDTGFLQFENGDQVRVLDVQREGISAVHYTDVHIPVGTRVKAVIDTKRRRDLMSQHTGQHLLSSVLEHNHNIPTLGWSLQPEPEASYIEIPRVPTEEELQQTIETCNELIREDIPVKVDVCLEGDDARPSSIPSNYKGGVIRHVTIKTPLLPNDRNACCGSHFNSLRHLQALHVFPKTTSIRGTNCRLYFVVGPRVLSNLATSSEALSAAALLLGCSTSDVPARLRTAMDNSYRATRMEKKRSEELAALIARDLCTQARNSDKKTALLIRDNDESDFITAIGAALRHLEGFEECLFVLASASSPASSIVLTGSSDRVNALGDALRSSFGPARLRGGGKGRWQGKLEGQLQKHDRHTFEELLLLH